MHRSIAVASLAAWLAFPSLAGPPDKSVVPADANWLVHADLEAAAASTIGKYILAHRADADLKDLDELKTKFGVDPVTEVHALTVFGRLDEGEDAVLLLYGTAAFDNVVQQMAAEARVTREDVEGYALLVWEDAGATHVAHIRPGKSPDLRLVYISSDRARLLVALRTLDHKAPSAADSPDSPLKASPSPGSFLFIDAPEIAGTIKKARQNGLVPKAAANGAGDHPAFLETIRGVNLDLGENAGKLLASVVISADTDQNAVNMMQAAQGFIALGRLVMSSEPDLAQAVAMLNAVTITSVDHRVLIKAAWNTEKLQALLESAEKHEHESDAPDQAAPAGPTAPLNRKDPTPKKGL